MMAYVNVKTTTGQMILRTNHQSPAPLNSRLPGTDVIGLSTEEN